jgi:hypothetical protein
MTLREALLRVLAHAQQSMQSDAENNIDQNEIEENEEAYALVERLTALLTVGEETVQ